MNGDVMTGGDWALCLTYTVVWLALIVWLIATALRGPRGAAEEIIAEAAAEVVAEAEEYTRQAS